MSKWIYRGSEGIKLDSIISFSFNGTEQGFNLRINLGDALFYVWHYTTANDLNAAIDLIKQGKE